MERNTKEKTRKYMKGFTRKEEPRTDQKHIGKENTRQEQIRKEQSRR